MLLKVLVIIVLAWLILKTVKNLVVAALGGRPSNEDRIQSPQQGDRGSQATAGSRRPHQPHEDVEDAVWEDLPE